MLRFEFHTGLPLKHLQKAQDYIRNLQRIMQDPNLSLSDMEIANNLLLDLMHAVNLILP